MKWIEIYQFFTTLSQSDLWSLRSVGNKYLLIEFQNIQNQYVVIFVVTKKSWLSFFIKIKVEPFANENIEFLWVI